MFERFTAHARRSVVMAQEEARRMNHNYIGTEHVLLGLLRQPDGVALRVLDGIGVTLDGTREQVMAIVGAGHSEMKGHIPFTPRAKKTLELALREALQLHNNYIGTEHILLGLIREGEGVAAQILRLHADLLAIRASVLDLVPLGEAERPERSRTKVATSAAAALGRMQDLISGKSTVEEALRTMPPARGLSYARDLPSAPAPTPAVDAALVEAARLAEGSPLGSHHLLLAALADPDSAAARVLTSLGVDLDQARAALRTAEVTGTSDEPLEEAGRRQMTIQVTDEILTVVAVDPVLVAAGKAALEAVNADAGVDAIAGEGGPAGAATATTIRGDHPAAASLSAVWLELRKSLTEIAAGTAAPAPVPVAVAETTPAADTAPSSGTAPSSDAA